MVAELSAEGFAVEIEECFVTEFEAVEEVVLVEQE